MFFPLRPYLLKSTQSAFTLIELLVVIFVLGIIAGSIVMSYDDVGGKSQYDLTKYEMAEIRKALIQFRRDSREFPCRVYRSGNYVPNNLGVTQLDFTNLPLSPLTADYHLWCLNEHTEQVDWGLSPLLVFPYDNTDPAYTSLLWNRDTKRGWNGPYINNQGLVDSWGNNYVLLDPELDYSPHYRCKENGGDYDITADLYSCLTANDAAWNGATYTLPANIARLVSYGPNGTYEGDNAIDPCLANTNSDDLVLCLLR